MHSAARSCGAMQRASANCVNESITYDAQYELRTRGSWVRILPARQILMQHQALAATAAGACFFKITSAGVLRDPASHTLFAASIRFANSAAE